MKKHFVFTSLAALAAIILLAFVGCTATSPAITADQAAIKATATTQAAQISALQLQLAADEKALAAATTQPAMAPQLAGLQAQVAADEAAIASAKTAATTQAAALAAQLAADEATAKQLQITTATQIGTAVSNAAPAPWGWIIAGVVGIAGAVATAYQTSGKLTAQNVIAAAAPGVGQLVSQATDGVVTAQDVTNVAQVGSVIALLAHPSASTAAPVVASSPVVATAVAAAKKA
jgi:hypothetical protein